MREERGFTIVAVLVALSLFALAMIIFLSMTTLSLRFHETARRMASAVFLAQEYMETIEARGWEGAVTGFVPLESMPADAGPLDYCRRDVLRRGKRFRLVMERTFESSFLEVFSVTCFWENRSGGFDRPNSVRLVGAGSRVP